jgi:ATP-dependent DNA ligase
MPVTFAAFDVLYLDGETVTRLPYVERRPCSRASA